MFKFKNKKISISLLCFLVVSSLLIIYFSKDYRFSNSDVSNVNIKGDIFKVEVVSTENIMQKGLGGREDICSKCGMLFKFGKVGNYSFWMKDMQFPLDIIWLADNKIVHIEKNIQPDFNLTMSSPESANFVLELRSGNVNRLDLSVGDLVTF
jgi:uncharacterized membrane protein (UPF0127 family)